MSDISAVQILFLAGGGWLASLAFMTLITAFARPLTDAAIRVLFLNRGISFVTGLFLSAAAALVLLLIPSSGKVYLAFALAVLGCYLFVLLTGLAAMSVVIGRRVWAMGDGAPSSSSSFQVLATGFTVLMAASCVPILGWLLLLVSALSGFGAVVHTMFQFITLRRREGYPAPGASPGEGE